MKTSTIIVLCMIVSLFTPCFADDLQQGRIIGNVDGKVKVMLGDRAIVDLGRKNNVIKGDILTIYAKADAQRVEPLGKCAVTAVYDTTSVCDIFKMKREIGSDVVTTEKVHYSDIALYPVVFKLMTTIVEPYAPEKDIKVFVHNIVDGNNNVTRFSEKLRREIKSVLAQKKRIEVIGKAVPRTFLGYLPSEYAEYSKEIKESLRKEDVDVIVAGKYVVNGDKILVSLYKVDQRFNDIEVGTTLAVGAYGDLISSVIVPYTPVKKEKAILCDVVYSPVQYKTTSRDQRADIVESESRNNPFLESNLKKVDFNIVSPVDFKVTIDSNELSFNGRDSRQIGLITGMHSITASFKKGYFYDDTQLFVNEKEISKSIVLSLDKPDDLIIEVTANPLSGKEGIDFKIYKKEIKIKPIIKPVLRRDTIKTVETFKD